MSNSSNDSNNVGNTGLDSATLAGIVSTIITFAALIVSSIQLLYQYYTNVSLNALGARNCNERVMGPWAKATRRRWRWLELRFEIIFESPVIFVAPASNLRGPVADRPIWYMDGSERSYEETRTASIASTDSSLAPRTTAIRRSINVEATWVGLLRTLQSMESESKVWHDGVSAKSMGMPFISATPDFSERSLAVAIQAHTLSWDFVPNFKKPFATSTISHVVEIAAMLGIHWTMWDPAADRYRAEGNGFTLLGSFIAEQGIVFQLVKHDRTSFGQNRLIPSRDIKQLCFGFVPTLYKEDGFAWRDEKERLDVFPDDPVLPLLKLGSRLETMETLMDIGVPMKVAEVFLKEDARVSHLFPVVFDVLGMLGRTISIPGYCFRMLPNPTVFRYDRRWFRTQRLLVEFIAHFNFMLENSDQTERKPEAFIAIESCISRLYPYLQNPAQLDLADYSPGFLDALRDAIRTVDLYLKGLDGSNDALDETTVMEAVRDHITCIIADLQERPSRFLDKLPFGRNNSGVRERSYMSFLFSRCRCAVTHWNSNNGNNFIKLHQELDKTPFQQWSVRLGGLSPLKSVPVGGWGWKADAKKREVAWCLLVFRLVCWLQLHDFHRDDVMIPRAATFGSRMPVYII